MSEQATKNIKIQKKQSRLHARKPLSDINNVVMVKNKPSKDLPYAGNANEFVNKLSEDNRLTTIVEDKYEDLYCIASSNKNGNIDFITTEREYDLLNMAEISCNYFSDESFLFEDDDNINNTSNTFKTFNTSYRNFTYMREDMCTPINLVPAKTLIKPIKEIRKGIKKLLSEDHEFFTKDQYEIEIYDEKIANPDLHFKGTAGVVHLDSRENNVPQSILYSTLYLTSIIEYQLKNEQKYNVSDNFLKKFTVTNLNRSIVINWLIKLQAYMKTDHALVYAAVRMMDHTLDSINIQLHELQLVALASFWICLKYHTIDYKHARWMVKQSDGAYSVKQLIDMEKKVLQTNSFQVYPIDLSIYVHYYILHLQIHDADIISQCSHFILDCALLDCRYVRILPSIMTSAVVYTSLHLMDKYNEKLWLKLHIYKRFYRPQELKSLKKSLIEMLKEMYDPSFQCKEPLNKFTSNRYFNATNLIKRALLKH